MEYVLGIDIGTGSVKVVAVALNGKPIEESQEFYPFTSSKPGFHEQDPEQIWNALQVAIANVINKTGAQPLAVGISSAMHSTIPVDEHCNALAPMITWADSRALNIAKNLRATSQGIGIYIRTGTPLHAMSPLCKLIWLKENEPDLFHQAHKFISIKEYIWFKLFGEFKIDYSIASGMGMFNIVTLCWDQEALSVAGMNASLLSEAVPCDYTRTYMPNESGSSLLKTGTPFVIGASDGVLANLGSMAVEPGIAAITIGTSGAVRVASKQPLPNENAMTFSYILDQKTYICGGPINNGGIAMQWWLKSFYGQELSTDDYNRAFQDISLVPAGCEGLIFLPYLTGDRAPIWDSESCGNFFGVKLQHGKAHFSRAVMEGICYALKDVLEAVQQNSVPITQINISGGFVRSDEWVQALADITGKKLVIVQNGDASATGAAFLAMKAIGHLKEYPLASPDEMKTFVPNPNQVEIYHRTFKIYRQLYPDLKDTMHRVFADKP